MTRRFLESARADAYHKQGYLFPVAAISPAEAEGLRRETEDLLDRTCDQPHVFQYTFNVPHLVLPGVHALVRDSRILDPVESLMGPDLLLWSAGYFIKEPHTTDFVGWHQDLRYWGLDDDSREITAWIALGDVARENGAMRFMPGSHRHGIVEHRDTWQDSNQLSRGQELAVDVDEKQAVDVELKSGEMSLHHGNLYHSSPANGSASRRIGLALRFISPEMRQVVGQVDYATLVRGEDRFRHFRPEPEPVFDLDPAGLCRIDAMLREMNTYYYAGAEEKAPELGVRHVRSRQDA
ncbi:MAG: phytanoyl-CoA dioxygenase family protein [bacterium]|nr:phytanoyl-CoA dioxygenase family protein [bacterium]